ncbi:MAG: AAA family ATPase [Oscillibacter sp.]|nr:AAA family ATPase [Oscillibacter sp.]
MESISDVLYFQERFVDPSLNTGLWWCLDYDDMETVQINAVCKAMSATWGEVAQCREFVGQFPFILVAVPPGDGQKEIAGELLARFGAFVCLPNDEAWQGCRSVKELREKGGLKAVDRLLLGCRELPLNGLLNIADVGPEEPVSQNRTFSGIPALDRAVGGFYGGELSVWTGKRGEGKSTLLGQMITEAVARNKRVCVYSGEMPASMFKAILYQQIAGAANIYRQTDQATGKELHFVNDNARQQIDKWINNRVFVTDIKTANAHDEDNILSLFEYAHRRWHCGVFLVDNIMTAALKDETRLGQWRAQSVFAARLVAFAQRFDVHVHLVAHPRKTRDGNFEADDVAGTADITNRASNVFRVGRIPDEKVEEIGCSAGIRILKNRRYGDRGTVQLDFDPVTRRFYPAGDVAVQEIRLGGERMISVWVVEYSPVQKAFHIDTVDRILEINRRVTAQGLAPGYTLLHIAATSEATHDFAAQWEREHPGCGSMPGGSDGR